MFSAFICIRAHLEKVSASPEYKLSLTSDQDPIQNTISPSSAVCQQASSRIPVPLFAEGGGRTLMRLPLTLHPWKVRLGFTPAAAASEISPPSVMRMCCLENMRAAQGPQGSTACVKETVRNVNLDISSISTSQECSYCFNEKQPLYH